MQLVSNPNQFDVMVLPNLYGSVVANVCCGIVGGPGIAAGSNYGDQTAVFEMGTRNTGVSIEGQNVANPVAFLMAGCKLCDRARCCRPIRHRVDTFYIRFQSQNHVCAGANAGDCQSRL